MDATVLIISELELDAHGYAERLAEVGFRDIETSSGDHLRSYLELRPDLVVLDLFSAEEERSILGSLRVGGFRNVTVPVIVVGDPDEEYIESGAEAVVAPEEVDGLLAMTAMAVYAERCRKLVERSRQEHPSRTRLYGATV